MFEKIIIYISIAVVLCLMWKVVPIRNAIKSLLIKIREYLESFFSEKIKKDDIDDEGVSVINKLDLIEAQIAELRNFHKRELKSYLDDYSGKMSSLNSLIMNMNSNLVKVESLVEQMKEKQQIIVAQSPIKRSDNYVKSDKMDSVTPPSKITYAMAVRTELPYGFDVSSLSNDYSGHFFEIEQISETNANFRLKKDKKIYEYALLSFNQSLNANICIFTNRQLSEKQTIEITKDGRLNLVNGVWEIVERMEAKFVNSNNYE